MNMCIEPGCRNPVPRIGIGCARHGGETAPAWAIYQHNFGWLRAHEAGDEALPFRDFSRDVDDALWFFELGAAEALVRKSAFSSFYEVVQVK
jgi:hypothetical protein